MTKYVTSHAFVAILLFYTRKAFLTATNFIVKSVEILMIILYNIYRHLGTVSYAVLRLNRSVVYVHQGNISELFNFIFHGRSN